ncbi:hypothetical protein niasHS_005345 [Heterodera schachtii]|uniref:Uncharacterized protein n=2 Tax=Heterodera TaxID=34509 RepID=A0ABD2J911_HETSC
MRRLQSSGTSPRKLLDLERLERQHKEWMCRQTSPLVATSVSPALSRGIWQTSEPPPGGSHGEKSEAAAKRHIAERPSTSADMDDADYMVGPSRGWRTSRDDPGVQQFRPRHIKKKEQIEPNYGHLKK